MGDKTKLIWNKHELNLLISDLNSEEIAGMTGKSVQAIRKKRCKLMFCNKEKESEESECGQHSLNPVLTHNRNDMNWTDEECKLLLSSTRTARELSYELGRTTGAIWSKRYRLLHGNSVNK